MSSAAANATTPASALSSESISQSPSNPDPVSATPAPVADSQAANAEQEQSMGVTTSVDMGASAEQDADKGFQGQEGTMMLDDVEEGQQWYQEGDNHELKRVKVYELINQRWIDQGTAFCFGHYDESTSEALLIARAESNYNEVILQTTIRSSDVYQRQQETLIVWTEPNGMDYALSFQDPEGCAEVWAFILEVQRIHATAAGEGTLTLIPYIPTDMASAIEEQQAGSSSPGAGSENSVTTASIIRSGHLPQPTLGIIVQIDRAIKTLSRTANIKEKICEYIQRADYLKAMIDVMHQAEDLENLENLHALCGLMQTILMMNDHSMYEHILDDDLFFGVVGMLEYDPEFPAHKANYREFLRENTHFHQPIPIDDISIQRKIHHTYRLQFLKDVVLARVLDDSTFNVLNSCIIFNQIDIIQHVQNDARFLKDMVGLFEMNGGCEEDAKMNVEEGMANGVDKGKGKTNGAMTPNGTEVVRDQHRKEVVLLIQQLCIMGKNVQLPARMTLFKTLVDRGILHPVQWALGRSEFSEEGLQMISVAGEILMTLLDHDVNGVREHVLRQFQHAEETKSTHEQSLLQLLVNIMVRSRDLAVQTVVGDALRMMLELPQPEGSDALQAPTKLFSRPKDDDKLEKFLDFFYKLCIHSLTKPLSELPAWKDTAVLVLTREKTNLYLFLCDLLSIFAQQHSFRSHFFLLTSNMSASVATLLKSKDKHLRLAALRYFRIHLRNQNRNFQVHLMKMGIYKPIVQLTLEESRRDTLVGSSCLEFFEYMRRENLKDIINHIMTTYEADMRELAKRKFTGPCISGFINRWEMNIAPPPKEEEKPALQQPLEIRRLEAEEEIYFNTDDEEDEEEALPLIATPPPMARPQFGQKRKRAAARIPMPMRETGRQRAACLAPITGDGGSNEGEAAAREWWKEAIRWERPVRVKGVKSIARMSDTLYVSMKKW
ncbi:hypothetical protein EWM64_g1093 [Hericium alpestre]|uniref:Uncharacterized protein n=1 Tax=Hericium alpestre TaxID=135208 RepID=A0A4Z0A9J7_9AGAM|nr:hypothetical protein EWM64_g1093 [Hericium alpestre]